MIGSSDITNIATPSWLRSQLSSLLDHHIAYRCCVKKYGTLLYRHGGDLVHALNAALGQTKPTKPPCNNMLLHGLWSTNYLLSPCPYYM